MTKYVAFVRAINVAGHATVSMSDLKRAFAAAGCKGVSTYIQSGNVIFRSPESTSAVSQTIRTRLRTLLGDEPAVVVRTARELERMASGAPLRDFETQPDTKLYVTFLSGRPRSKPSFPLVSSKEALEAIAMKNLEVFIVSRRKKNGFYGFPNNFIEKELGISATSRNWSTVTKVVALLRQETAG